MEMQYSYQKRQ